MNRSRIALAAALALGLAMPAALPYTHAEATQAEAGPRHGGFKAMLGLSDEQAKAIRDIHARQGEARKQIGQSLRQAHKDMQQLALNGGTDDAIQAKRAEIEKLTGQMTELRVKALQEMAPLLTAEQKEKLSQAGPGWGRRGHFHRQSS
jgi:Spy/CpxP family protein refolding chaperone